MNWYKVAQKGWQEGWHDDFGDIQRYIYDAYDCSVYLSKLANEKITVSVSMTHMQFGHIMYQDFWRFGVKEESEARSTYKKVKAVVSEMFEKFRSNDIPNNLIHSHIREAVRFIDAHRKPTSRIPFVDWAREQKGEDDWRSSIYGTRYPKSDGF
jgi:Zn-dependent oligopeptidase